MDSETGWSDLVCLLELLFGTSHETFLLARCLTVVPVDTESVRFFGGLYELLQVCFRAVSFRADTEQLWQVIKGKGYTKCIDWWSLGVMLYELLGCGGERHGGEGSSLN